MRDGSSIFLYLAGSLCLALGASMAACSGDVVENNPSGSGAGGSGGSTTTSTTTTETSTETTTTTTTTTTTGPLTVCDDACAHAAECGFPVCQFQELDCANPQYECAAQCIVEASCAQIATLPTQNPDPALAACVYGCQGGGAGGGGGGPPAQECGTCLFQNNCLDPIQSCTGATDCNAWGQCAQDCGQNDPQPSCFDACDAMYPGAAPAYTQLYQCACTSCETDCMALMDPCNQGGTGGAGGAGGMGGSGGAP